MAKSSKRDEYQKALMEMIQCRPVAYWPKLARVVGGAKAGILLSQLLYWNGDAIVDKRDGWILKSVDEMQAETGLTPLEQQTARKILISLNVLSCALRGAPRIWHYRIDVDKIAELLAVYPLNGKPVERETHSTVNTGKVARDSRGMFTRKPVQLNKLLKTTSLKTTEENTSSSSTGFDDEVDGQDQEEEGRNEFNFSDDLHNALNAIGLFEVLKADVERAINTGITEDQIMTMINDAKQDEPVYGKTAALFIYRLKHRPPMPKITGYNKYAEDAKKYGYEAGFEDDDED